MTAPAVAPPAASVIVCAYSADRRDETIAAIQSVLGQTLQPVEVILAVDSNPELAEELREVLPSSVTVTLNDGTRGLSETRNLGVRHASSEVVAFLDDDAVAEPNWLEELLRPLDDDHTVVVGGSSIPAWETGSRPAWFPREYEFVIGCTGHLEAMTGADREIRNPAGSNMAFRKQAMVSAGGWKPELGRGVVKTGGEEAELCLRIKSQRPDAKILHVPSAIVHHRVAAERATFRYVFPYAFHEGTTRAMLRKYASQYSAQPLAGERRYLHNLVTVAIPARLRRIYRPSALSQLLVILVNTALVAAGYLRGRLIYR